MAATDKVEAGVSGVCRGVGEKAVSWFARIATTPQFYVLPYETALARSQKVECARSSFGSCSAGRIGHFLPFQLSRKPSQQSHHILLLALSSRPLSLHGSHANRTPTRHDRTRGACRLCHAANSTNHNSANLMQLHTKIDPNSESRRARCHMRAAVIGASPRGNPYPACGVPTASPGCWRGRLTIEEVEVE